MSLSTSMLRVLLARGTDPETILAVAEAAEAEKAAADEARREKRREGNRVRQRAWYDRHVRDNASNIVSSCDNQANAVMQREDGEVRENKKSPTPPINYPDKITPSLPSEASGPFPAKARRFEWPSDYREQFWAAYRRKTDRKKALVVLDRLYRADRTPWMPLLVGAQRVSASSTETEFLAHPSTWLRNERWDDELPEKGPPPSRPPPGQRLSGTTAAALARRSEPTDAAPTLDLQPALRPFPGRRSEPTEPAYGDDRAAGRDPSRTYEDRPGTVHDLAARRAYG